MVNMYTYASSVNMYLTYSNHACSIDFFSNFIAPILIQKVYNVDLFSSQVTKLLQNYRAHPVIMSLYSPLFYDNELIVSASDQAYSLQNIPELITQEKPLIFHGLQVRQALTIFLHN